MTRLSEERRAKIEEWAERMIVDVDPSYAVQVIRDLLAESAALRTTLDNARQEIQRLWTLGTKAESAALRAPASPDDLARVAEIRERVGKITPGDWSCVALEREGDWEVFVAPWTDNYVPLAEINHGDDHHEPTRKRAGDDARFIAHAPDDIAFLLARLTPPTGPQER